MKGEQPDFGAAPVDAYATTGGSCPDLCTRYNVDVREFVLLACIGDLNRVTRHTLIISTGLSQTTVQSCVRRLSESGLVRLSDDDPARYTPTTDGLALLRQASGSLA